jgi:hypothetical protein
LRADEEVDKILLVQYLRDLGFGETVDMHGWDEYTPF